MSKLLTKIFLKLVLIVTIQQHILTQEQSTGNIAQDQSVYKCSLAYVVSKKDFQLTFLRQKSNNLSLSGAVTILLLCGGDIESNPGPSSECIKKFRASVRKKIYQIDKLQKKFIESTLHGHFLQRYADAKVPPPGLRLQTQKSPETGHNQKEINEQWSSILQDSAVQMITTLIEAHKKNTTALAIQLAEQRARMMLQLKAEDKETVQSWLVERALYYRNKSRAQKLKKFKNHVESHRSQEHIQENNSIASESSFQNIPSAVPSHETSKSGSSTGSSTSTSVSEETNSSGSSQTRKRKNRRTHRNHTLKNVSQTDAGSEDIIVNLSDHELSTAERCILSKGLKFIPTPTRLNKTELLADTKKFSRRMRLAEFFADNNTNSQTSADNNNSEENNNNNSNNDPVRNKYKVSTFTPEFGRERCLDNYLSTLEKTVKTMRGRYQGSNITPEEEEGIQTLRHNENIVIFPADKGGGLVIQNRKDYIAIVEEHLDLKDKDGNNVYQQLQSDITSDISKRVENAVMKHCYSRLLIRTQQMV